MLTEALAVHHVCCCRETITIPFERVGTERVDVPQGQERVDHGRRARPPVAPATAKGFKF